MKRHKRSWHRITWACPIRGELGVDCSPELLFANLVAKARFEPKVNVANVTVEGEYDRRDEQLCNLEI